MSRQYFPAVAQKQILEGEHGPRGPVVLLVRGKALDPYDLPVRLLDGPLVPHVPVTVEDEFRMRRVDGFA